MTDELRKQISLELGDHESEGIYSNLVLISHSGAEFIFDFARIVPGKQKAKVYSRIIKTPQHAKSFLMALEDNIKKFETQHGEIKLQGIENRNRNIGFQSSGTE